MVEPTHLKHVFFTLDHFPGDLKPPTRWIVIFKCIPGPKIDVSFIWPDLWFMVPPTNYPRDQKGPITNENTKLIRFCLDISFLDYKEFWAIVTLLSIFHPPGKKITAKGFHCCGNPLVWGSNICFSESLSWKTQKKQWTSIVDNLTDRQQQDIYKTAKHDKNQRFSLVPKRQRSPRWQYSMNQRNQILGKKYAAMTPQIMPHWGLRDVKGESTQNPSCLTVPFNVRIAAIRCFVKPFTLEETMPSSITH